LEDNGQGRRGRIRCRSLDLVVEQDLGLAIAEQKGHEEEAAALVPHAWERARARWGWVEKGGAALGRLGSSKLE